MYLDNSTIIHDHVRSGILSLLTSPDAINVYIWLPLVLSLLIFVLPFVGPLILSMTIHFCSIILWMSSLHRALNRLESVVDDNNGKNKVTFIFYWMSIIWHGYRVVGKRNLPQNSPAVFVFYQRSLPIDFLYFISHLWRRHQRSIFILTHKKQYLKPGWKRFNKRMNFVTMSRKNCVDNLFNGDDIILPLEEDIEAKNPEKYTVNWNGKIAFATIACAAKVPIIPVFTKNIEEAFWIPWFLKIFANKWKYPIVAGGLPVKLITYIGKPIVYDANVTAKELADKAAKELQTLIDAHQMTPGNRFSALLDRIWEQKKEEKSTKFTVQCEEEGFPQLNNNNSTVETEETLFSAHWPREEEFSDFVNSQKLTNNVNHGDHYDNNCKSKFSQNGVLKSIEIKT